MATKKKIKAQVKIGASAKPGGINYLKKIKPLGPSFKLKPPKKQKVKKFNW